MVGISFFRSRGPQAITPRPTQTDLLRLQAIQASAARPNVGQQIAAALGSVGQAYFQGKQLEQEQEAASAAAAAEAEMDERRLSIAEDREARDQERFRIEEGIVSQEFHPTLRPGPVRLEEEGLFDGGDVSRFARPEAGGGPDIFGTPRQFRSRIDEALAQPDIPQLEPRFRPGERSTLDVLGEEVDFGEIEDVGGGQVRVPSRSAEARETLRRAQVGDITAQRAEGRRRERAGLEQEAEIDAFRRKKVIEHELDQQYSVGDEGGLTLNQRRQGIESAMRTVLRQREDLVELVNDARERITSGDDVRFRTGDVRGMEADELTTAALEPFRDQLEEFIPANGDLLEGWKLFLRDTDGLKDSVISILAETIGVEPSSLGVRGGADEDFKIDPAKHKETADYYIGQGTSPGTVLDELSGAIGDNMTLADVQAIVDLVRQGTSE